MGLDSPGNRWHEKSPLWMGSIDSGLSIRY